jgi:hypothetical protein
MQIPLNLMAAKLLAAASSLQVGVS